MSLSLVGTACARGPAGPAARWVHELADDLIGTGPYVIAAYDELEIRVWNQPNLSGTVRVRPDGSITAPLIGDVVVAGQTPEQARARIQGLVKGLVVDPQVTLTLVSIHARTFSVLGAVARPGRYPLQPGDGVLQGLAAAGGLSEIADPNAIFVLSAKRTAERVRFTFDDLARGVGTSSRFKLRDGDTVIVGD